MGQAQSQSSGGDCGDCFGAFGMMELSIVLSTKYERFSLLFQKEEEMIIRILWEVLAVRTMVIHKSKLRRLEAIDPPMVIYFVRDKCSVVFTNYLVSGNDRLTTDIYGNVPTHDGYPSGPQHNGNGISPSQRPIGAPDNLSTDNSRVPSTYPTTPGSNVPFGGGNGYPGNDDHICGDRLEWLVWSIIIL